VTHSGEKVFLWKTNEQGQFSKVDIDPSSQKFIGPTKPFSKKLRLAALCLEGFPDIRAMAQYSHPLSKNDYSVYEPFWTDKTHPEDLHFSDLLGFGSKVKSLEVNPLQVIWLISPHTGNPCGWITSQEINDENAVKAFIITAWMGKGQSVTKETSPQFQIDKDLFTNCVKYLF